MDASVDVSEFFHDQNLLLHSFGARKPNSTLPGAVGICAGVRSLLVHGAGHHDGLTAVLCHLEVAHERRSADGAVPEPLSDILDGLLRRSLLMGTRVRLRIKMIANAAAPRQ